MITPEDGRPEKRSASPARDYAPYLAEASQVLTASLDYQTTMNNLAHFVVPSFADWCAVDVVEEDGVVGRLAIAHEDPKKVAWARELQRRYPPDPEALRGVPSVLRTGKSEWYREVTDEMLVTAARDSEHLRIMREVGFTSAMIVPLVARGQTLGAITLVLAESGRRYEDVDLVLGEDLARRAALALDNARLYGEVQRELSERQELEEDRARLAAIVESSDDVIIGKTLEGIITSWNQGAQRTYGYSPEETLGQSISILVPPERPNEIPTVLEQIRRGEKVDHFDTVRIAKDGRRLNISLTVSPIRDPAGDIVGASTIARDITERKRAEGALRSSEERLSRIVETNADGIMLVDRDGKITFANAAAEKIFGLTRSNITKRTYDDPEWNITTGNGAPFADGELPFARVMRAGEAVYGAELSILRPDGNRSILSVNSAPLYDTEGRVTGMVASFSDVTERKRAEDELRESQRTLATLMSNLPGMAYRCRNDEDWTMEFVSEGCFELVGYPPDGLAGNRRFTYGELIHSDDREAVWEAVQVAVVKRRPFQVNYRIMSASGAVKWVWEQGQGVFSPEGELQAIEGFVTDQTERVRAYRLLEERVSSLTRIAANLTVERPMAAIIDALAASVVEASTGEACFVTLIDDASDAPRMAGSYGLPESLGEALEASWRAGARSPALRTFHEGKPLFVGNARQLLLSDPLYAPTHHFLRETSLETALIVPLVAGGKNLGAISVYYLSEREPAEDERVFLSAIADQAAVAVENARLYEDVRRRVQERSALLNISNNVASTLRLEPLLDTILEQLKGVVDYVDSSVLVFEGEELATVGYRGPAPRELALKLRFSQAQGGPLWKEFESLGSVIIDDVWSNEPLAVKYRTLIREELLRTHFTHVRAWMGVPLVVNEQPVGLLAIIHDEPGHYTERHAELARIVANQAAVAIENARLYERAQSLAALEERQRLARELHDSVSQALYGITLGSDAALTLLERDPSRLAEPLEYVRSLAEAGLAEMRALIFELRPESLENEGLIAALEKQAAALRARHDIDVRTTITCAEPDISLGAKETLYRIAQEALHNTVKHARASRADLKLDCKVSGVTLEVGDDGAGFDPEGAFPGHLGLKSMHERAERLGGTLEVESTAGKGTRILARLPSG